MRETFLPELFEYEGVPVEGPYLAEIRMTIYLAPSLEHGAELFRRPSSPFRIRPLFHTKGYDLRLKEETEIPFFTGFSYLPFLDPVPRRGFTPRSCLTNGSVFLELPSKIAAPSNIRTLGTTLDFLVGKKLSFFMLACDVHKDVSNGKEVLVPEKIIKRLRAQRYIY